MRYALDAFGGREENGRGTWEGSDGKEGQREEGQLWDNAEEGAGRNVGRYGGRDSLSAKK